MGFTKITAEDTTDKGVIGLADTPNLSTQEMQEKLDELALEVIVPKFNNLVDELDATKLDKVTHSEDITDFRLDSEGSLQVSKNNGESYSPASASGHTIVDGAGKEYPARKRMQFSQNVIVKDYDKASGNKTYIEIPKGEKGEQGEKGKAATIAIRNVTDGETAKVTNVGSSNDAILDFVIPKGNVGESATVSVGTVTSGESASVTNRGTESNAIFDFVLPKGEKGDIGGSIIAKGHYTTEEELVSAHPRGNVGDAYIVGVSEGGYDFDKMQTDINSLNSQYELGYLGKNLVSTLIKGKGMGDDGSVIDYASTKITDYVEVKPNTQYTFSDVKADASTSITYRVHEYNASKGWIKLSTKQLMEGSGLKSLTFTTSANAKYVRINIALDGYNDMLCEGTDTDYVPYSESNVVLTEKISDSADWLKSRNIFDKNDVIVGQLTTSGVFDANTNTRCAYCQIEPNTTYTVSKVNGKRFRVAYITKDITQLSNQDSTLGVVSDQEGSVLTITVGADAKYLIVSLYDGRYDTLTLDAILDTVQIEKGASATPYAINSKSNVALTEIVDNAIDNGYICENLVNDSHIIKGFVSIGATSGSGAFSGMDTIRSVWFKAKKNTTYTLVSDKSMNRRVIHECANIPQIGVSQSWINIPYDTVTQTDKRLTFTTNNADFNYVVVYYTNENVDMYVQVVEGTQTDIVPSNKTLAEVKETQLSFAQGTTSVDVNCVRQNNRVVYISCQFTASSNISAYSIIATVPNGYRPTVGTPIPIRVGYNIVGYGAINTDGQLLMYTNDIPSGSIVAFSVSYII